MLRSSVSSDPQRLSSNSVQNLLTPFRAALTAVLLTPVSYANLLPMSLISAG